MRNGLKKYGFILIFLLVVILCNVPFPIQAADVSKTINIPISIPILCYHRVIPNPTSPYDLTPGQLEAHFQYFKSGGYTPITVSQFLEYRKKIALFPEKPLVLTFDDGSKSHYTQVLPLLKKYGFKATFYIFPNAMNGSKKLWLSWEEVSAISQAGMDIGSHTLSHPYLTVRDKKTEEQYRTWLEKEMQQSKKILEEKLKIRVNTLAYPFGLYDSQVEAAAIKAGYMGMLNINTGLNRLRENPFRLKRRLMVNTIGPKSLRSMFAERILDLEILSPLDASIAGTLPLIRFRVKSPSITTVKLEFSKYQATLKPDTQGFYTFEIPGKLRSGFQTVVVRGWDADNNSYFNSWGFYYRPEQTAK